jgi:putative ABC transport system permease protein
VAAIKDPSLVMQRSDSNVTASVKLYHFTEITEENLDSFHFHGDLGSYPISAVITLPDDVKAETLLQGRFLGKSEVLQVFEPHTVITELLQNIFRIKNVLDAIILLVSGATVGALGLVFSLSLRLRQKEVDTIFKIGCDRATISLLLAAEIGLIVGLSLLLVLGLVGTMHLFTADLVRFLFL